MNYEAIYAAIESIGGEYLKKYIEWLTEKLKDYGDFGTLSLTAFFLMLLLLMYAWLRARD